MRSRLKKILPYIATAIASLMLMIASGCDVHEFPSVEPPAPPVPPVPPQARDYSFRLQFDDTDMPVYTVMEYDADRGLLTNSGRSVTDIATRHIIRVYTDPDAPGDTRTASRSEVTSLVLGGSDSMLTTDRDFELSLLPGNYIVAVWSDYCDTAYDNDLYYDTTDFTEITLRSTEVDGLWEHQGNTPQRDAFRGERRFTVTDDGTLLYTDSPDTPLGTGIIEMRRPLASPVFVATDLQDFMARHPAHPSGLSPDEIYNPSAWPELQDYEVVIRYSGYMPSVFNNLSNKPVGSISGAYFNGLITPLPDHQGSAELGRDYVFVNGAETRVQVAIEVYDRHSHAMVSSTPPLTIPLVRNHLTIVTGRILTSNAGLSMGIDPGFDGEFNIEIR